MLPILSKEQITNTDNFAIKELGVSAQILMENAAHFAKVRIDEISQKHFATKTTGIVIFCGSGNNGGDGFALARHLLNDHFVAVYWIGSIERMSTETRVNFEILNKLIPENIIKIENPEELNSICLNYDIIIDALIGVGGTSQLSGLAKDIIKFVKNSASVKIAIDNPTGLDTDTGIADEDCFSADYTITMFGLKKGLLLNDGYDLSGEIYTADLGLPTDITHKFANTYCLERKDVYKYLPERKRMSTKFDYGRLAIIAGSDKYPGAAALTANAAVKTGAGLVYLLSTTFHNSLLPEVIQIPLECNDNGAFSKKNYQSILDFVNTCDAIIIGPGLSDDFETIDLVTDLIYSIPANKPILIDADGLRAVRPDSKLRKNIVITPHSGEFSRIIGVDRLEIEKSPFELAQFWASKLKCIVHLKHSPSISSDGVTNIWNLGGNPGMATGGSGDVLSGIIGALLAQKVDPLYATSVGAFIHALAGDHYAKKYNFETLSASNLISMLRYVL